MNNPQPISDLNMPAQAVSACGARIRVTPSTPYILYRDEIIYFCGPGCKQLYYEDPMSSCMAARLLSGD
jgi:hypothetical protein